MPAHFLGVLGLIAAALLLTLGLGVTVFALARGDRPLARRAGVATWCSPRFTSSGPRSPRAWRRTGCCPLDRSCPFAGLDCHLHVSIVAVEKDEDRIGMVVRARSDAKAAEEFPRELQFRLVGKDGSVLVPFQEGETFIDPLAAGASAVDTVAFVAPFAGAPYSLRVVSRGIARRMATII